MQEWEKKFDEWVDVTGFVTKNTSYYFEVKVCCEDAYREAWDIQQEKINTLEPMNSELVQRLNAVVGNKSIKIKELKKKLDIAIEALEKITIEEKYEDNGMLSLDYVYAKEALEKIKGE